ncbi:MAG: YggT family protein [Deferribacteres bacterium]|nr:YggT family protein [candidate division KSB1 bacterium]MCB9504042.1 YggT family protein [Deferribacteres bacterium]
MFVFANFFTAIAKLLNIAFTLYTYVMIAHVVLSWIRVDPNNQIVQFIYRITEPVLGYVRQYVPPFAGLDFSPIIVIIVLQFLQSFLVRTLFDLANSF